MPRVLQDALDLLDLESWLSQYTIIKDGGGDERRLEFCPKCGDRRYKLYVNIKRHAWICYVCDWGRGCGDVVDLLTAVSNRSESSVRVELSSMVVPAPAGDVVRKLQELFGDIDPLLTPDDEIPEVDLPGTPGFTSLSSQRVLAYAKKRGLTDEEIVRLRLRSSMRVPAKTKEVLGPWLIFPVYVSGKTVAWQGRMLRDSSIKYLSSHGIKNWLWPLDPRFFKVYTQEAVCLVEGVFDALGLLRYNVPALCTFGKSISKAQTDILRNLQPKEVIFIWDIDAYGEMAKAVNQISYAFPRTSVVDVDDPVITGKVDPGDALIQPWVVTWLAKKISNRMDVRSPEFFQWRMKKL